jgi:hypothetical protein
VAIVVDYEIQQMTLYSADRVGKFDSRKPVHGVPTAKVVHGVGFRGPPTGTGI